MENLSHITKEFIEVRRSLPHMFPSLPWTDDRNPSLVLPRKRSTYVGTFGATGGKDERGPFIVVSVTACTLKTDLEQVLSYPFTMNLTYNVFREIPGRLWVSVHSGTVTDERLGLLVSLLVP